MNLRKVLCAILLLCFLTEVAQARCGDFLLSLSRNSLLLISAPVRRFFSPTEFKKFNYKAYEAAVRGETTVPRSFEDKVGYFNGRLKSLDPKIDWLDHFVWGASKHEERVLVALFRGLDFEKGIGKIQLRRSLQLLADLRRSQLRSRSYRSLLGEGVAARESFEIRSSVDSLTESFWLELERSNFTRPDTGWESRWDLLGRRLEARDRDAIAFLLVTAVPMAWGFYMPFYLPRLSSYLENHPMVDYRWQRVRDNHELAVRLYLVAFAAYHTVAFMQEHKRIREQALANGDAMADELTEDLRSRPTADEVHERVTEGLRSAIEEWPEETSHGDEAAVRALLEKLDAIAGKKD